MDEGSCCPLTRLMLALQVRAVLNLPHRAVRGPGPMDYFPQGPGVTSIDWRQPRAQLNITTNLNSAYD
jgi:hypothetical protein